MGYEEKELARRSGGRHFDERGSDGGRFRDWLACPPKAVEVKGDRLADQLLHSS
jgi:hypothetical protein